MFVQTCKDFSTYFYSNLPFGPTQLEGSLVSSLQRKAFAVEYLDNYKANLLLDERINDDEFYWADLNKFEDEVKEKG